MQHILPSSRPTDPRQSENARDEIRRVSSTNWAPDGLILRQQWQLCPENISSTSIKIYINQEIPLNFIKRNNLVPFLRM